MQQSIWISGAERHLEYFSKFNVNLALTKSYGHCKFENNGVFIVSFEYTGYPDSLETPRM